MADRYLIADELLGAAGFTWYELSNWATSDEARCRHNLLYWTGGDWWGFGPGAHSHVGGVRWWNVKHPTAYAARLAAGESPGRRPRAADHGRAADGGDHAPRCGWPRACRCPCSAPPPCRDRTDARDCTPRPLRLRRPGGSC